jgi:hypothetical protein
VNDFCPIFLGEGILEVNNSVNPITVASLNKDSPRRSTTHADWKPFACKHRNVKPNKNFQRLVFTLQLPPHVIHIMRRVHLRKALVFYEYFIVAQSNKQNTRG